MSRQRVALVFVVLLALAWPSWSQHRILALLQDSELKNAHSTYFSTLSTYGFVIEQRIYSDSSLKLKDYDTWLYDHVIIFAPKAQSFGGRVNTATLLDFIDSGRNVVIAASSEVSETIRSLVSECGIDLEEKGSSVYDHFSYVNNKDHTLIISSTFANSSVLVGNDVNRPIAFKGVALSAPADAELISVALSASPTAYSGDQRGTVSEASTILAGENVALVSVMQARNNARVLVAGSLSMFSDEFYSLQVPSNGSWVQAGNLDFTIGISRWAFQQQGVLRAKGLRHNLLGGTEMPSIYRVNDDVEFAVDIQQHADGQWLPYRAEDVQVEFVMLDPHVRLPLTADDKGTFYVQFKVPDVYGVFKYVVDYKRLGFSYIQISQQVPVRPFRHDEYERFLIAAYPYYASAISTMLAFFGLGCFYLYHK